MRRTAITRQIAIAAGAATVLAFGPTGTATAADTYPMSEDTFVHDEPSTSKETRIGMVWRGERVKVLCQDTGPSVHGNPVWDYIEYTVDGTTKKKRGFVADYPVRTGVVGDLPGMRRCDDDPDRAPADLPRSGTYQAAFNRAFSPEPPIASSRVLLDAPKGREKGLLVARFFIPAEKAATGFLRGDDRGYSSDPTASSRMILTWDQEAGRASFVVTPSHMAVGGGFPALPLVALGQEEVLDRSEQDRSENYYNWDYSHIPAHEGGGTSLNLTVGAVNSFTSKIPVIGSWSVDGILQIIADDQPRKYTVNWEGNAYPAMEVLFYPRESDDVRVVARRNITPAAFSRPARIASGDSSGAPAALDINSWAYCSSQANQMTCEETGKFTEDTGSWPLITRGVREWTTSW
jgi:hypothetical protein